MIRDRTAPRTPQFLATGVPPAPPHPIPNRSEFKGNLLPLSRCQCNEFEREHFGSFVFLALLASYVGHKVAGDFGILQVQFPGDTLPIMDSVF